MISALNAAVTGIQASLEVLNTSAHNVANSSTEGFKKDEAHLREGPSGGVVVEIRQSTEPGPTLYASDGSLVEGSNVDLAKEATRQILADTMLRANAATVKTASEMQGTLIDILI